MKLNLFCMPTVPAASMDERAALRPIGRNAERYHAMVEELRALAKLGDELGVHAISTTEHHFHTEGFEANPNPLLLFADIAARTERIYVAPMSVVVTPENPIRVAENIAMLDVMTKGRVKVGFARGYQKRWVQIIGQTVGVTAAQVTTAEDDANNQRIFEEFEKIIFKAWNNDVFDFKGEFFSVPYPYEEGIDGWAAVEFSRRYGADGEFDENGIIRKIGTVPAPWQKPHPEIWRTSGGSRSTVIDAAHKGYVPFLVTPQAEQLLDSCRLYQSEAAKAGHNLKLGQKVGVTRSIAVGRTDEEAWDMGVRTTGEVWHNYFNHFGFGEPLRYAHEDKVNYPVPFRFNSVEETHQRLADTGMSITGTADKVKRELEQLHKCYENGELEYLCWMFNAQGLIPIQEQLDQVGEFMLKVWKPMFG
ncbi:LLM class flavin-dependent oxidoreductase [Rhizorhabdus wittichii]|uniref:LLM class flavin-dependent oxidoreductase n=1 Tax=Rhizorhabdus wittichii TaxID=160791 RepID=UPI00030CF55D|nr:LLM class flavin-dependent oxidoreductase [Rhizorhabdus wittichii]